MTPEEFALQLRLRNGSLVPLGPEPEQPSLNERIPAAFETWGELGNALTRDTGQGAVLGGIEDLARKALTTNTFGRVALAPWVKKAGANIAGAGRLGLAMAGLRDWQPEDLGPSPAPPPLAAGEVSPLVDPSAPGFSAAPFPWEPKPGAGVVEPARAAAPPRTRAILLPGGKIVYTNMPSSEGSEISMSEAGRLGRDQDRANLAAEDARLASSPSSPLPPSESWKAGTNFEGPRFSPVRMDPTTESMKALVRSAARATEAADRAGSPVEGTTSVVEGTKFQQDQRQFEDALQAAALAQVQQEQKLASMPPQEAARLGNRDVVAGQWQLETIKPMLDKITEYTIGAIRSISDPGNPSYIADEKQRAAEVMRLEDEMNKRRGDAIALGSVLSGQRIPAQQY